MLRHKKHKKYDPVNDYRFPTSEEITIARRNAKVVHQLFSPIFLTAENMICNDLTSPDARSILSGVLNPKVPK
ncbi:unnamed protein product [Calypogeia fissa]